MTTPDLTLVEPAAPAAPPTFELPDTITLPLSEIKPYWRNPRKIPESAVDAVAESISRYGYQQPIVVDTEHVVVVGHTRLRALAKLGWTSAPVLVASHLSADKIREYRLVDNRTGEATTWDHDALVMELREFETSLIDSFFPDVDLEINLVDTAVTEQNVLDAGDKIQEITEASAQSTHTTTIECPSCTFHFDIRTRSLPIDSDLLDELIAQDGNGPEAE